jgi:fumarylacetoacetate (FAA) hydrolase
MKLVTFRTEPGWRDRGGVIEGSDVVDLAHAFAWYEREAGRPCDDAALRDRYGEGVLGFIENAPTARPAADAVVDALRSGRLPRAFDGRLLSFPLASVTLRAPLPSPPSLRDGYAFRQHVEAARRGRGLPMIPEFDRFPVFYFSNHRGIVGPGDVAVRPLHLERLDYELEAAVVVGRRGIDMSAEEADRAIFGLTILNDWSARALQLEEMKLNLGPAKGKDFATSMGPYLVTVDELADRTTRTDRGSVFDLEMRASVNGTELSRGNLRDMSFTFAEILARASYGVELVPGDVVGSGTCGTGCLLELNASRSRPGSGDAGDLPSNATDQLWLAAGDAVVLEIDGLGRLENRVVLYKGR